MKKLLKRGFALLTTAVLILGLLPSGAFAAETGTITGESDVEDVVFDIVVPTDLSFALDPFSQASTLGQVTAVDYKLVNKSKLPVQVSYALNLDLADDVTLLSGVGSDADYDPNNTEKTKKILKFGIVSAKTITGDAFATGLDSASITYDDTETTTVKYFDPAGTQVDFDVNNDEAIDGSDVVENTLGCAYQLGAATVGPPDTLAADTLGTAAFRLYAKPNAYAEWEPGDITIKGSYKLNPLTATTWAASLATFKPSAVITTRNLIAAAYDIWATGPKADVTIAAGETKTLTRTIAQIRDEGFTIYLPGAPALSAMRTDGGFDLSTISYFSHDVATGIITVKYDYGSTPTNVVLKITTANGLHTLNLTVS